MDETIVWPDEVVVKQAEELRESGSGEDVMHGICISDSQLITARFGVSTKGNGTVVLPGLTVRVYDRHLDGATFRNGLLRCEWRRSDDYSYLDLVVTGIAVRYDEKGEKIVGEFPVRGVFRYSSKEHRFFPIACSQDLDFWSSDL